MTTPDEIVAHGIDEVTRILGRGIAEQIFEQIQKKKRASPANDDESTSTPGQSTLNRFG